MTDTIKSATLSNPTAATETDLLTAAAVAVIGSIFIVNRNASSRTVNMRVTNGSNTLQSQIVSNYVLGADDTLRVPGPINIDSGEKIRVTSSGADVDFIASYIEVS
jgi:hypothetical protein